MSMEMENVHCENDSAARIALVEARGEQAGAHISKQYMYEAIKLQVKDISLSIETDFKLCSYHF